MFEQMGFPRLLVAGGLDLFILGLFGLEVLSGFDVDYLNRYFSEKKPPGLLI